MIRLDCAGRASAISLLAAIVLFGAGAAEARAVHHHRHHHQHHARTVATETVLPAADPQDAATLDGNGVELGDPVLSIVSEDEAAASDTPVIVKPARHIYCVEFARILSGISIFGDAKTWWDKARLAYAQEANPSPGSVMVFDTRRKMRLGHVAVVRRIVTNREIRVDHANWGRDGKLYLNAPVIDVSENNDWSRVRVWNTRAGRMGSSIYAIKGFVANRPAIPN